MPIVDFPSTLTSSIVETKSRETASAIRQGDPTIADPHTEGFTDDREIKWTFQLKFKGDDDNDFRTWFETTCASGRNAFRMPVTVFGMETVQVLRFSASGVPQLITESNDVFTYQCEAYSRGLDGLPGPEYVMDWEETYGSDFEQAAALDTAINVNWP